LVENAGLCEGERRHRRRPEGNFLQINSDTERLGRESDSELGYGPGQRASMTLTKGRERIPKKTEERGQKKEGGQKNGTPSSGSSFERQEQRGEGRENRGSRGTKVDNVRRGRKL